MKKVNYFELGATLYIPILNKDLDDILSIKKYPFLKSIVICLEDSIRDEDVKIGMKILESILINFNNFKTNIFIRPRNNENLQEILKFKNIGIIDGFALGKFDTKTMDSYLYTLKKFPFFYLMPILETKDVFSIKKLNLILEKLLPLKENILAIRIGGEDILNLLCMMRDGQKTLYEIMPLYLILSTIINIFKPNGFNVSSPVFSSFGDEKVLLSELKLDIEHQIFNKTSIHPRQIEIIQSSYKITKEEYFLANKLLREDVSIFKYKDKMYEKATHTSWAKNIISRFDNFGINKEENE